jgi:hypothetical protein
VKKLYDPKVRELVRYFHPGASETLAAQLSVELQQLIEDFGSYHGACDYCGGLEGQHETSCSLHPDYDPTP